MLLKKIYELPQPVVDFIRLTGRLGDEKGVNVYVVGGFVRDLFLGVDNFDMDLVVEGDGIAFAQELAHRLTLRLVAHKRFGTATLLGLEGLKVDIASARKEIYETPAALPVVSSGQIEDDLFRRDFTINAMAVSLNAHNFGKVVDFYGGQSDLKSGIVRALHPLSFIDDPTRILRAVRFEQRFDFKIEKKTLAWIRGAVRRQMLHRVQKHRLRDEIVLIFREKIPFKSVRRLSQICGFSYIWPRLRFQKKWAAAFEEVNRKSLWFKEWFPHKRHLEPYVMYMCLFFYPLSVKEIRKAVLAYAFHKRESLRILSLRENFQGVRRELLKKNIKPSSVYRALDPLTYEVILLISILAPYPRLIQRVENFLFVYNGQRLHVRGEDLKKLGIKPGPAYKKILQDLLYAKVDGKVRTKEQELEFLRTLAKPGWVP